MRILTRGKLGSKLARWVGHTDLVGRERIIRRLHDPINRLDHDAIQTVTEARDGTKFFVDTQSMIEYDIWAYGGYEQGLRRYIQDLMSPGEVYVDIGANVGMHSCCIARWLGPSGLVVAVEPISQLASRLRQNVDLNKLGNVIVVEMAAGAQNGEVMIYPPRVDEPNQMLGSLSAGPKLDESGTMVALSTVDTLMQSVTDRSINVLKIDVEGHELGVLMGAHDKLVQDRPVVIFEHASGAGKAQVVQAELLVRTSSYLSSVGYEIVDSVGRMLIAKPRL